ncbi:phosphotransferase [Litchfieldia salsa]|uniref:Ser/Thr protein kinase RdoA involved in Cpx stress response, MazF antagonist n=1 Tax=Litchfieldia salsa TaxID=930152 RepID=A0A1H0TB44_9BACI|nr:phosphotransferase [Litchfieldia salsa]SDP51224.1 Ser/Thr protein kinase RdoA involved in Cpx stress response, MazF antagonist [Litchfieldia salsa]
MVENHTINYTFLSEYFDEDNKLEIYSGKSGYNNTTRYLNYKGEKFILRIYDTHKDELKVKFEHEVLLKLNQIKGLPFSIPKPLFTKDGHSFVRLKDSSDKIACIYHFIEGVNPDNLEGKAMELYGEQTGFLLNVLKTIQLKQPVTYRPYYEIEYSHPKCQIDEVVEWCSNPPSEFHEDLHTLRDISEQLYQFNQYVPKLKKLPHQLIHGDLNESNILTNTDGMLKAILDFEFVTYDLRVMEVAVCISEIIIKESDERILWNQLTSYISGISSMLQFTKDELNALPILIQLRRLDVFLHFLGRYLDSIDDSRVLKEQICKIGISLNWINLNGEKLIHCWNSVGKES